MQNENFLFALPFLGISLPTEATSFFSDLRTETCSHVADELRAVVN